MVILKRTLVFATMSTILMVHSMAGGEASSGFLKASYHGSSLGVVLAKSSAIKVGQTLVYLGKEPSGRTIEVILTRTKRGLVALDGTCAGGADKLILKRTQLICQKDGSVYQASTGEVVLGPNGASKNSIHPLTKYTITEKAGNIYIK